MVGRILLIILGLLILLIFFVPYGVDAGYEEGVFSLRLKAGPFRFRLYPKKPPSEKKLAKKQKKKEKSEARKQADADKKKAKKDRKEKPAEEKPAGVDETITVREKTAWDLETITALAKMAVHALRRFFRSFHVDYLKIHYTVAGSDPYSSAIQYGQLCAAAEALPEICNGGIRNRDIALACDFTERYPSIDARIVLSVQLYKVVHMAAAFLAEYIVWKMKTRREKKTAALSEREDDNGRQPDQ